jgi:hypothetical protein
MSLELNAVQAPVVAQNTPVFADWGFNPNSGIIRMRHRQGDNLPSPMVINTTMKDIVGTPLAQGYTDFRRKVYARGNNTAGEIPLISVSGTLVTEPGQFGTYNNGMVGDVTYTFINFNLLSPRIYSWYVYHEIWGRSQTGEDIRLSRIIKALEVTVLSNVVATFSEDAIYINWRMNQDTGSLAGPFTISGESWTMFLPSTLYFNEIPNTVRTPVNDGVIISGQGTATFYIAILFFAALPNPLPGNPFTLYLDINNGMLRIPVIITILQESGFYLEHASMFFEAYKGIQEAEPQTNHMSFPGQYHYVLPPWLNISPGDPVDTVTSLFTVISSDNMEPGTYFFKVEIRSAATDEFLAMVGVTYIVHGNILSPYPTGVNAFTLDKKFIELNSDQDGMYYDMAMKVTVSEMYTMEQRELPVANFKYPLFKKKQKFNIGLTVDRLMSRMKDFTDEYEMAYLPAKVSISLVEKSFADPAYSNGYTLPDIYFIAGLDPGLTDGCCILDINTGASRVTPSSIITINYLIAGTQRIAWYKNNVEINSYMRNAGIWTDRIAVSDCVEGDVFKFVIETSMGSMQKVYKLFPEGRNATKVYWENEYKLQSEMLFLGDYTLKSELEARTQTLYIDLTDVLAKLEDTKVSKITINTGWLLKSDVPSIESLMRAKRAAIRVRGNWISMVPISKAITNVDSKRALISFDVEFQINRNFNEEIYSF